VKLEYPCGEPPQAGETREVAPGVLWVRMPLPFALSHINLWMLQDGGRHGVAIVDTGIHSGKSKDVWRAAIADRPVTRVLVTHLHPDHAGCAGWLCSNYEVGLWMTRQEYLLCRILVADTGRPAPDAGVNFYYAAGFPGNALARYQEMFGMFGKFVAAMPESYHRLVDGMTISIGGSDWEVVVGNGHSPEHACLYNSDRNVVISGDQLLPAISSNVSVYPTEPHGNPLKDWLLSLQALKVRLPEDVLVLPAHGSPFRGAHARLDALTEEHTSCLAELLDLCVEPQRAVDVFPALFKAAISDSNLIMATGESIAHLNYLLHEGAVEVEPDAGGVLWYRRR